MTWERAAMVSVLEARRSGWALPPLPPDAWVEQRWGPAVAFAALLTSAGPFAAADPPLTKSVIALAAMHAIAATAAVAVGYCLLVQASVETKPRVRALAVLFCVAGLLLATRGVLAGSPAEGLGAASRVLALLVATVLLGAVVLTWFSRPRHRWLLLVGTSGGVAAAAVGTALEAYGMAWWLALEVETLLLLLIALLLGRETMTGYRRQSRHWRELEGQVRVLRTASTLLRGRSVTPEDDQGLPEEDEVRKILANGAVRIALQPVVEIATGRICGREALSRFGGRVPTDRWFRAASHYGLGAELERLTLGAAVALLPGLPEEEFLALNISPLALSDETVLDILRNTDLDRIVVEITEHEAVANYDHARATLGALRTVGARIAVDDTGAGFASLRHVLMLQPDVIKLDMSLTRHVDTDVRQQTLVRALTRFAGEVGTLLLAEGVETKEQLDVLRDIGVSLGQGWHLGVPEFVDD